MRDYFLNFVDSATAQAALSAFWVEDDTGWTWSPSCVLATDHAGAPFGGFLNGVPYPGYWVCVSTGPNADIAALPQCLIVGDRDSATVVQTSLSPSDLAAFSASPVLSGMKYFGRDADA